MASPHHQLGWAFKRLAQAQSNRLDNLRFSAAFNALPEEGAPQQILAQLCQGMGMQDPQWLKAPDPVLLPCLAHTVDTGWFILTAQTLNGNWEARRQANTHLIEPKDLIEVCASVDTGPVQSVLVGVRYLEKKTAKTASLATSTARYGCIDATLLRLVLPLCSSGFSHS